MKKGEIVEEIYDENIMLNVIYEILDKFYQPFQNDYPLDVASKMEDLINTIGKYIYPSKKGFDLINEKHQATVTYRKC